MGCTREVEDNLRQVLDSVLAEYCVFVCDCFFEHMCLWAVLLCLCFIYFISGRGDCRVEPPITPAGCACYWNLTDTDCACCSANHQERCCQVGKADKHACAKCVPGSDQIGEPSSPSNNSPIGNISYSDAQISWLRNFKAALAQSKVLVFAR